MNDTRTLHYLSFNTILLQSKLMTCDIELGWLVEEENILVVTTLTQLWGLPFCHPLGMWDFFVGIKQPGH
jgi:hypothetical protein